MLEEMIATSHKAVCGYMQAGDPTPVMEWVMHPSEFMELRYQAARDEAGLGMLLQRRVDDGEWEFAHHVVRQDVDQRGWKLQPIINKEPWPRV